MTQTDPNAFLMSAGAPSFKFENVGDTVRGVIRDLTMQQQRDPKTQAPKFWNDQPDQPMMQLRVTLVTDLRDPANPNDDGQRAIYVKGEMQKAIREAIKAAGKSSIEEGGTLVVRYEGDGQATVRGYNPPKLYRAKYEAPVRSVSTDDL